jgi:hypothetical protein
MHEFYNNIELPNSLCKIVIGEPLHDVGESFWVIILIMIFFDFSCQMSITQ